MGGRVGGRVGVWVKGGRGPGVVGVAWAFVCPCVCARACVCVGGRYEILGVLGKGSFGVVTKCYDWRSNQLVALKIIRNKKRFHHQARRCALYTHTYIIYAGPI